MTLPEIILAMEQTGRVQPIARTSRTGLILPDGRIFAVRNSDPNETHDRVLEALGLNKIDIMIRYGFIRKIENNYQFDFANRLAKTLIEADILKSSHAPTDVIYISNSINGRFDYNIIYSDFLANGSVLPNPRLRETYF